MSNLYNKNFKILNISQFSPKDIELIMKTIFSNGGIVIGKSLLQQSTAALEIYSKIQNSQPSIIFYSENDSNEVYSLTIGRTADNEIFIDSVKQDSTGGSLNLMPTTGGSLILPKKLIQNNKCLITFSNTNNGLKTLNDALSHINFANTTLTSLDKYDIYDPKAFLQNNGVNFKPDMAGFYKIKVELLTNDPDEGVSQTQICLNDNTVLWENIITDTIKGNLTYISGLVKISNTDLTNASKNSFKIKAKVPTGTTNYIKHCHFEIEYLGPI